MINISGVKLKTARETAGKTLAEVAVVAGWGTGERVRQLEKAGGRVNSNIHQSIKKFLGGADIEQ